MKTKQEQAGIYVASITAYDQAGNVTQPRCKN